MEILPFQPSLRPELPNVYRVKDYENFRAVLIKIDKMLTEGGLEQRLVEGALTRHVAQNKLDANVFYASGHADRLARYLRHALRCNIARHLSGESYRAFSLRLADSQLFQWFTHINEFNRCKAISKSSLGRYEKAFDQDELSNQIKVWLAYLSHSQVAHSIGLEQAIDFDVVLADTACVKANIHFPVDWVLLRDAARTLLLAINCIRKQGLKHRMVEPSIILKQMNQLCIEMTHCRRKADSKKRRKFILRQMKKLSNVIEKHARRYRDLLANNWQKTDWSEAQANQVLTRVDNILNKLPEAIHQAHERIIGERQLPSNKKLLSLYDDSAEVIVRGKAGNEVEFGQRLLLTEQLDGLIVDWEIFGKQAPSDSALLKTTFKRCQQHYGPIKAISTDRAFNSKENDRFLEAHDVFNVTCPRSPKQLQYKLQDPCFSRLQTRRSQTEARIGIIKNVFLGRPLKTRILENKKHALNWCVLTHNLWVLARKIIADEKQQSHLAQAA